MPQLIPFFFVNQVLFNFLLLTIIIYVFTKYLLPRFVRLFKTRLHINSL
jgi:F-type H+-transporting ATPase subunit 8